MEDGSLSNFTSYSSDGGAATLIGNQSWYPYNPFPGSIDDVRIYNRALSDAEIAQLAYPLPVVTSVTRNPVPGSNSPQSFTINGANFDATCTVTLRNLRTGEVFANCPLQSVTSTSITLNQLFTSNAAQWSVQVISPVNGSSGQYFFQVAAPTNPASITGVSTLTSQSTPQTVTITGSNFTPGSQVKVQSLSTGATAFVIPAFLGNTLCLFNYLFSVPGQYSITVVDSNGQSTQPVVVPIVASAADFQIGFPLKRQRHGAHGNNEFFVRSQNEGCAQIRPRASHVRPQNR